eukprot:1448486-Pyramimonas_sp.AAC.1
MGCGAAVGPLGAWGLVLGLTLLVLSLVPCWSANVRVRPLTARVCAGALDGSSTSSSGLGGCLSRPSRPSSLFCASA